MAFAVGLAAGIMSGCGIGGGSLLLLYLTAAVGMPQYAAAGLNLWYFLCCAPVALIVHVRHRLVVTQGLWLAIACGAATAAAASWMAGTVPTDLLRRGFGALLLIIGCKELFCKKRDDRQTQ